eukprot:CAMPEP_0177533546 /NCGR_PEP_ID=MMETSP0369-20130122/55360_1 /TAXON_ID=447022 ORGANISM="Scrippsiella hangoei-like, Strain SHHI-4" /NCGR_SAMPLE_ID=MMETSP0369 /ASSEMBLY_ACC=CAM_ASM_000364 /LENGTH=102 /DNA_ID=CAMNT_0019015215 /DNA_START=214 /DNA_END=522 /DNA_ORIENTATION=+
MKAANPTDISTNTSLSSRTGSKAARNQISSSTPGARNVTKRPLIASPRDSGGGQVGCLKKPLRIPNGSATTAQPTMTSKAQASGKVGVHVAAVHMPDQQHNH